MARGCVTCPQDSPPGTRSNVTSIMHSSRRPAADTTGGRSNDGTAAAATHGPPDGPYHSALSRGHRRTANSRSVRCRVTRPPPHALQTPADRPDDERVHAKGGRIFAKCIIAVPPMRALRVGIMRNEISTTNSPCKIHTAVGGSMPNL